MTDERYDVVDESAFDAELVHRDDEALDVIGAPRDALSWDDDSDPDPGEQDAVLRLLRALRDDVEAAESDVAATVVALHGRRRRLGARGVAVASVAAVVLSAGGVAAASVGAAPGSLLYPIRQVVTLHHAPNAGLVALGRLVDNAEKAIKDGRLAAAHSLLAAAQRRADSVAAGRLSSSEQKTFAIDQSRLSSLRAALTALESASAVAPGASGSAPRGGHASPAGTSRGDGSPDGTGHAPAKQKPPANDGGHPGVVPGSPAHRLQPARGSSSAASRTPSANPRA